MPLKYPDILEHSNEDLPLVDADYVKGGVKTVADLTALYALSSKTNLLKEFVTIVYVQSVSNHYTLTDISNVDNSDGWTANPVATPYSLPTATNSVLGGVKIGNGITITSGVISAKITGTVNNLAKFTATDGIGNANITDDGTTITVGVSNTGRVIIQGIDVGNGNTSNPINDNVLLGSLALSNMTDAIENTSIGYQSGIDITTGSKNVLLGKLSGFVLTTGSNNLLLGYVCGSTSTTYPGITTGSNNTFIGSIIDTGNVSNHVVIACGNNTQRIVIDNLGTFFFAGNLQNSIVTTTAGFVTSDGKTLFRKNLTIGNTSISDTETGILSIKECSAAPTNTATLGKLYVEGGALKYISPSGTITTIGPA